MAYETKPGSGTLFKNGRKEKDSHPDMRGDANIDGTMYEVAAWTKITKGGDKFLSLAIKPKDADRPKPANKRDAVKPNSDDDVPF